MIDGRNGSGDRCLRAGKLNGKGGGLMRQGQQNRRNRGRGRNSNRSGNPLSRSYESNGPEVKIKGSAAHIAEKYMTLARDALSSGNTVTAENYFQHAEHYNRIIQAAQAKQEENAANHHSRRNISAKTPRNAERKVKQRAEDGKKTEKNIDPVIPGSGKQPDLPDLQGDAPAASNGNGTSKAVDKEDEKPRRRLRPRKPKIAKTASSDKNDQDNIIA